MASLLAIGIGTLSGAAIIAAALYVAIRPYLGSHAPKGRWPKAREGFNNTSITGTDGGSFDGHGP